MGDLDHEPHQRGSFRADAALLAINVFVFGSSLIFLSSTPPGIGHDLCIAFVSALAGGSLTTLLPCLWRSW